MPEGGDDFGPIGRRVGGDPRFPELATAVIRQMAGRSRHVRDLDAVVYIDTPCCVARLSSGDPLIADWNRSCVTDEMKEKRVTKVIAD